MLEPTHNSVDETVNLAAFLLDANDPEELVLCECTFEDEPCSGCLEVMVREAVEVTR